MQGRGTEKIHGELWKNLVEFCEGDRSRRQQLPRAVYVGETMSNFISVLIQRECSFSIANTSK